MKIEIDLPATVKVVERCDVKGNDVVCLEIAGIPVLYADPDVLECTTEGAWEDIFASHLGRFLADRLLASLGTDRGWVRDSPTGREIRYPEERF